MGQLIMREGRSRKAPCRAEGVNFRKSNEAQIVELECAWSKQQLQKENNKGHYKKTEGGFILYSGDENSNNDRGCGEEFGNWEIFRLEGFGCSGSTRGILICWDKRKFLIWRWANFQSLVDLGKWKMGLSECSWEFMVCSLERIGNACGKS